MADTVIRFKDFGFQYKVQQKPTLYDINLEIHKGEKVLILGGSGAPIRGTTSIVVAVLLS